LNIGFPNGKKSLDVRIPSVIKYSNNLNFICSFLSGLFDTDGNIFFRKSYSTKNLINNSRNHYPIISITTISKGFADDLNNVFRIFGFKFSFHIEESRKFNQQRAYIIKLSGLDQLDKWMRLVGMKNDVKLTRYLVWKKCGFCPTHTTLHQREEILKGNLDVHSL